MYSWHVLDHSLMCIFDCLIVIRPYSQPPTTGDTFSRPACICLYISLCELGDDVTRATFQQLLHVDYSSKFKGSLNWAFYRLQA